MRYTTDEMFKHLQKLIPGIPDHVVELTLHLRFREMPKLEVTFIVPELNAPPITKTFKLEVIDENL